MPQADDERRTWGVLALAGALGVCCLGFTTLLGGSVAAGGTVADATAATGTITTLGGLLAVVLATALPLLAIGLVLTRRAGGR